jgi:hypothetical protein
MLTKETWSFPISQARSHAIGMKNSKPQAIMPVRSKTRRGELGPSSTISRVQLRSPADTPKLFGEWQQRGPETFSGHVFRKLRFTLAPPQLVASASARG